MKHLFSLFIIGVCIFQPLHSQTFLNGNFEINRSTTEPMQIKLINPLGQTVLEHTQFLGSELDLTIIPKGLYTLQIQTKLEKRTLKIVKE